jgi:hypothetical protein
VEARWHEWSEEHVLRHALEWHEVEEALQPPIVTQRGRNGTMLVLGRTYAGRYLSVVVVPDDDAPTVFVVTARPMDDRELRAYEARKKQGR